MNKYNLIHAFRSLKNNKIYSTFTISGFAISFSIILVVGIYVYNETTVDNYYPNSNDIYLAVENGNVGSIDNRANEIFKSKFPEVKLSCPVYQSGEYEFSIETNNKLFSTKSFISTTNNFFTLFAIDILQRSGQVPLEMKKSISLSESTAKKLFGEESVLNKEVKFMGRKLIVSSIYADIPKRSSFHADFIVSIDKFQFNKRTKGNGERCYLSNHYLLLNKECNISEFTSKVNNEFSTFPTVDEISFQPIRSFYFSTTVDGVSNRKGSKSTLLILVLIAISIFVISLINYINFSLSKQVAQGKSIAIRTYQGAGVKEIRSLYATEISISLVLSLFISLFIVAIAIPQLNLLFSGALCARYLMNPWLIAVMLLLMGGILMVGLMITMKTVRKSHHTQFIKNRGGKQSVFSIKSLFCIVQFVAVVILLVVSITIQRQIHFVKGKNLGFQDENLLQVQLPYNGKTQETMAQQISQLSFVESASRTDGSPAFINFIIDVKDGKEGFAISADKNFLKTFNVELLLGRLFRDSDKGKSCYVTESYLREMELGEESSFIGHKALGYDIVGVVKDFHTASLHQSITPTIIPFDINSLNTLNIRLSQGNIPKQLKEIEKIYKSFMPDKVFQYKFYDEVFDSMYKQEEKQAQIVSLFCIMAIFITTMGLFGVILHIIHLRTKEIGIRKVNGATIIEILSMLNLDFIKWVAIAFVVACPVAYFAMAKWLENFAYKTELSWWIFALAGVLALAIALFTVSWQSWRAATRNPVEALRYE